MSWSNQGGGGPWGGGRGGGGGPGQPPDFDELLRRGQEGLKRLIPGGAGGGRGIALIGLVAVAIWLASGVYRVQPDEQGVVLRFGEAIYTTTPGLHYHWPTPIESVLTPKVTRVNRVDIGFRSVGRRGGELATRDVTEESLMLTGDENIVDINFTVFWLIKDAKMFLFNIRAPELTIKMAAESAMREIIGKTPIQPILAEGRRKVEQDTEVLLQRVLDDYGSGIQITQLQLQKVDPPGPVVDSFRDVQRARADLERLRNEAEAYRNDIIPRARGEAAKLVQDAEAYKQEVVARSEGDAKRFLSVYNEYKMAKEVTTQRIYLETMEEILRRTNKIIIDSAAGRGPGVVPYLPLPEIQTRTQGGAK
ncbi:MAG: FtsH protease activity modulator HflK [Alphaproteobacteria bacterium]